jgi:hypothetical protein
MYTVCVFIYIYKYILNKIYILCVARCVPMRVDTREIEREREREKEEGGRERYRHRHRHSTHLMAHFTAPARLAYIPLRPNVARGAGKAPRAAGLDVNVDCARGARLELGSDLSKLLGGREMVCGVMNCE